VTPKPPPGYGDDNNSSAESSFSGPTAAVGKWPLKPGVLVHSKQQSLKSLTTAAGVTLRQSSGGDVCDPVNGSNTSCKSKNRAKSMAAECVTLTNETQSARAARIRRMMIGTNNNDDNNNSSAPNKPSPKSPPPAPPVRKTLNNTVVVEDEKTRSPAAASGRR